MSGPLLKNMAARKAAIKTIDIFLFSLKILNEALTSIADPLGIKYRDYDEIKKSTYLNLSSKQFNNVVYRALGSEHIERQIYNGKPVIRLTLRGAGKVEKLFKAWDCQDRKWDGNWRMVTFDVREVNRRKRDGLRKKLKELGFAKFQKSLYISPLPLENPLREFLEEYRLAGHVSVIVGRIDNLDARFLAGRLWNLEQINSQYRQALELFQKGEKIDGLNLYLSALRSDPGLPRELLPENWAGDRQLVGRQYR